MTAHGLIDTTEMYLRTLFELEEEGIVPLRARIAERLGQSGPTVSQTVARMERDGLVHVQGDRHLELTAAGHDLATQVMRKHRLAECLLLDVIGLPWEDVHVEACRWEHVMSEDVERRLVALLHAPGTCPHGNPIPGLVELGAVGDGDAQAESLAPMTDVATTAATTVVVRRISEQLQSDTALLHRLHSHGIRPGLDVTIATSDDGLRVTGGDDETTVLSHQVADHVFVAKR